VPLPVAQDGWRELNRVSGLCCVFATLGGEGEWPVVGEKSTRCGKMLF
jgi:hypothetical protein